MGFQGVDEPAHIQNLNHQELEVLSQDVRAYIIDQVSKTGGHLASNLGTVELTVALLHAFDFTKDQIVWDVGHQSYAYKILTGRARQFDSLRQKDGLSGFPKREESPYDFFNTGHSSTALSASLGLARAKAYKGEEGMVIAVVGDGAMTGGLFYESINNIDAHRDRLLLILNDNQMSIGENVGLFTQHLARLRVSWRYFRFKKGSSRFLSKLPLVGRPLLSALAYIKQKLRHWTSPKTSYFEALGLRYYGPIDGHDLKALDRHLNIAKAYGGPVVLHICTQKGRGYAKAEDAPEAYHGVSPFSIEEGLLPSKDERQSLESSFTDAFSTALMDWASRDERVFALTAAMCQGTGLTAFSKQYPNRFFDVGIAEQHELCMAAGLATAGLRPVVCVYSSFLQRALDQVLHDIALQNLPVLMAVDRTGLVGADGETHQGLYDASFLMGLPNVSLYYASCYEALKRQMAYFSTQQEGPTVLRYPRGAEEAKYAALYHEAVEREAGSVPSVLRLAERSLPGQKRFLLLALGHIASEVYGLYQRLLEETYELCFEVVECLKPLDQHLLERLKDYDEVVSVEEQVLGAGLGSVLALQLAQMTQAPRLHSFSIPTIPMQQAKPEQSRAEAGLCAEQLYRSLKERL